DPSIKADPSMLASFTSTDSESEIYDDGNPQRFITVENRSSLERSQLSDPEWSDHQTLIELRNQAVAHVNPEHRTVGRTWHKQLLFAVSHPSGYWRLASSSNETSFHLDTFSRLERMLPVAHAFVLKQFNKRMNTVTQEINSANLPVDMLRQQAFDPVEAFGSIATVKRLLAGSGEQTDSFWYNE
ncbi:hypothetical protein, partial [Novosphingobium sp.]|uniref:hypothetical protein n=1 Tax=Novosphingobium sp. TaxID=1874826 RepID=UPI00260AF480